MNNLVFVIRNKKGSIIAVTNFEPNSELCEKNSWWYEEEIPIFTDINKFNKKYNHVKK